MSTSAPSTAPVEAGAGDLSELPAIDALAGGGRRHRRRRFSLIGKDEVAGLNLTAMLDMMTILLVFLVKSYSVDATRVNINEHLRPPVTTATEEVAAAVTITITTDAILVDDAPIVMLADLDKKELEDALIVVLRDALMRKVTLQKQIEKRGGTIFDGSFLVVAHEEIPYSIITAIMYTAGQAELTKCRLMLMKQEEKK